MSKQTEANRSGGGGGGGGGFVHQPFKKFFK